MTSNAAHPSSSDAVAFADRIGELLACMRSAEAELGALLVEIEQRGVMELFGYRSAARLLEHLGDVPKPAAERLVRRARSLNPGRNLDGTPIPALAPATGAAARTGRLSNPMVDVITGVLAEVPCEHRDSAETHLLTFAAEAGHKQVAALGARILAHLAPDGAEPDDTEPVIPPRELFLRRKRTGVWELNGRFDDETGARASALLDALAERRTSDDGPDHRTLPQRYGDAFSDAMDLALNSPDLPMQAGERAHVMVAVSLQDLKSGVGKATLGDTGEMTAAEARVHACDAMIIPAVLGDKSEPLNLGRLRRLISAGLRRALFLRDRGCAFPGCHRPPRHCQGHHIRHWADGGLTDLGNLVLMCAHHHRLLHRSGWEVRIAADGLPEFLPPVFIDRRRKPRRNNLHDPLPFAA
ncbi:HNH endonuclease signature motif containing protein [Amycolatopsis rifamycinica]|uniref:HNH endonuclease n=1 Tax=Amycolatopsis rifamycinica TaxID=287986 RepID=A0A066TY95_9PSEU|nr:HNH endonuclease signature motif containing protein [Amycolatopsis rifamycinica]KDN16953.1 HNH endonuclease [Amycolatopsis rifamycinica]